MNRPRLVAATAALVALAAPALAHADAIDDPCQEAQLGAPCTTRDGEEGTCVQGEIDDFVCDPYEPCDGKAAGTACTKPGSGEAGTCQAGDDGLVCTPGGGTTAATTGTGGDDGAGGTDGATTGATTGSGTGGGSSGGATEDDGCAVKAPGKKSATRGGAAAVFLAGVALTVLRSARRARRDAGRS